MSIGFDLDDTLTDIQDDLFKLAVEYDKSLRGKGIVNKDKIFIGEKFDWSQEERDYFLKNIRLKAVLNARVRDGVIETFKELKRKGYKIIIITARSNKYYDDPDKITINYLNKMGILYDKVITNSLDKYEVCKKENISYFIDDNLDNCLSVSKLNTKVFLLDIGLYKDLNYKNIIKIANIKEILKYMR